MHLFILLGSPFFVLASASPEAVSSCTAGNDTPCLPNSTCTPTQYPTTGQPWLGQCIATPTSVLPSTSIPIVSTPPPIWVITDFPMPSTSTECHVGWDQCNTGSTCTPTMTCHRPLPRGSKCIATPTPQPSASAGCMVGWENQCNTDSTCTPIETCYRLRPCRGACIATATPTLTISPSKPAGCNMGREDQCGIGSTCTPTMTCSRGRYCGGACIAEATTISNDK